MWRFIGLLLFGLISMGGSASAQTSYPLYAFQCPTGQFAYGFNPVTGGFPGWFCAAPAAGGGSGVPGGISGQVQFNNAGAFGGSSGLALSSTAVTSERMALGGDLTGDLYYNAGGGLLSRLQIGTAGQVLTVAAGLPTWVNQAGGGNVSSANGLGVNQLVLGQGSTNVATLGSLGTSASVLHGNSAGLPSFGPVNLGTDISGTMTSFTYLPNVTGPVIVGRQSGFGSLSTPFVPSNSSDTTVPLFHGASTVNDCVQLNDTAGTLVDSGKPCATPGGISTQAQYNFAGVLGGSSGLLLSGSAITGATFALGSDATGDIYYNSGSGVLARLPIGTSGQSLTVSGGLPAWTTLGAGGNIIASGTFNTGDLFQVNNSSGTAAIDSGLATSNVMSLSANQTATGNKTFSGTSNFSGTFELKGTSVVLPVTVGNGGTGASSLTSNVLLKGGATVSSSTVTDAGSGVTIGSPSGGAEGAATLNATGLYVAGNLAVSSTGNMTNAQLAVASGAATIGGSIAYGATGNSTVLETGAGGLIACSVIPVDTTTSTTSCSNGQLVAAGGTGVNAGTSGQVAYYASSGSAVSGENTVTLAQENIAAQAAVTMTTMQTFGGI